MNVDALLGEPAEKQASFGIGIYETNHKETTDGKRTKKNPHPPFGR